MATIREVAEKLGVSISTVSAVVNNRAYVSAKMSERVTKALREANYSPDQIARSLRLGQTHTIALIVPDLINSFYSRLMRGAEDHLAASGYRLLVADSREDWKRQQDYLRSFSGRIADGIILAPCMASNEQIAQIPGSVGDTPLVYVDRTPLRCAVDQVLVDNVRASFEATSHLVKLGHRRIGIVTGPLNLLNAADRLGGYRRALRAHGVPVERSLIRRGDYTEDSGYWRGLELLRLADRPTAILVCNNLMAMGFLGAMREFGIECPREISVVGFDDFEWSSYLQPPLTTVRQPAAELGAEAAKAVLKRIRHPGHGGPQKLQLLTQLVVRGSTAAPNGSPRHLERENSRRKRAPSPPS